MPLLTPKRSRKVNDLLKNSNFILIQVLFFPAHPSFLLHLPILAVQEWIDNPPEPLTDLRRADTHRGKHDREGEV